MTDDEINQPYRPSIQESYSEAGAMHRHYSITRTSVLTLSYTVAFGIAAYSFNYRNDTDILVFLIGFELFLMLITTFASSKLSSAIQSTRSILLSIEAGENTRVHTKILEAWRAGDLNMDYLDRISIFTILIFNAGLILAHFYFL